MQPQRDVMITLLVLTRTARATHGKPAELDRESSEDQPVNKPIPVMLTSMHVCNKLTDHEDEYTVA